jgi:tRNA threonylcarbamoyl adenosine modification protein YeaZ
MSENEIILAIETAVAGGSISLFSNGKTAGSICGDYAVSRVEALLPGIKSLLDENGIDRSKIGRVVVSTGPGSFTGIRIGLSTALGLSAALGVEAVGVPLLPAMSLLADDFQRCACVIPISKTDIGVQFFESSVSSGPLPLSGPEAVYLTQLPDLLRKNAIDSAVLYSSLIETTQAELWLNSHNLRVIDAGTDLSRIIASREAIEMWGGGLDPIYLINPAKKQRYPVQ